MNVVAIIQARMGSTRLPGKVLMKSLANKTLIEILYLRLQQSKNINKIILATSKNSNNTPLIKLCQSIGLKTFQGSEEDVLERYYQAALAEKADLIVRITGDCPLIDYQLVDDVIEQFKAAKYDFVSNNNPPTYPDGLDVEAFTFETLQVAHNESKKQHEREHVTPYMKESGKFKTQNLKNEYDYSDERWTVDEIDDYVLVKNVLEEINDIYASWQDIMELKSCFEYLIKNPQPSYLRLDKSSNYQIHKKKPNISPGKWIKVFDHKKNVNNKEIYLTTGAVIEFVKDKIDKKKYKPRSLFSIPLWGMKFKKNQNKNLQNFKKIIVVEDHLKDGGFQSWLNESFTNEKLISKSINSKVIGKVGSKEFLMNYLK